MSFVWASNLGEYSQNSDWVSVSVNVPTTSAANYASMGLTGGNNKAVFSSSYDVWSYKTIPDYAGHATWIFHHTVYRAAGAGARHVCSLAEGGTEHVSFFVDGNGKLYCYRGSAGGTLLGSTANGAVPIGQAIGLSYKVVCSDTVGTVEVRLNGGPTPILSLTGQDTKNGGAGIFNTFFVGGDSSGATSINVYQTNFVILDGAGSTLNDFIGNPRVLLGVTPAAGSLAQWTPLSSTNVSNIDDPVGLHDGDTTYVQTTVNGNKDSFTFSVASNWTGFSGAIKFVFALGVRRTPDAGTHTDRLFCKSGATTVNGTTLSTPGSYGETRFAWDTDPNTGAAWAGFSAVAAAEFGYEKVS